MSQQQKTIIDSIQSEVSKEASPLYEFLIRNSRKIIGLVAVIVVAAAAYGGWSIYEEGKIADAREEFGALMIRPESPAKVEALEKFAAAAPGELRRGAYLALAYSATQAGNQELAASAWSNAAEGGGAMYFAARLGEANALKEQGKNEEALLLLDSMLDNAPVDMSPVLNSAILDLAENMGRSDRALRACEDILDNAAINIDKTYWRQRAEYLRQKIQAAG